MRNQGLLKLLSGVALIAIIIIAVYTSLKKEEKEEVVINEYPLSKITILNTEIKLDEEHKDYNAIVDCNLYEENVQMINYKVKKNNSNVTVKTEFYKDNKIIETPSKDMDRFDVYIDVPTEKETAKYHISVTCEGYNE